MIAGPRSCWRSAAAQKGLRGDPGDGRGRSFDPGRLPHPRGVGVRVLCPAATAAVGKGDPPCRADRSHRPRPPRQPRDLWCAARPRGASLGHGLVVGHGTVALLMRRAGIAGVTGRPSFRRFPNMATHPTCRAPVRARISLTSVKSPSVRLRGPHDAPPQHQLGRSKISCLLVSRIPRCLGALLCRHASRICWR